MSEPLENAEIIEEKPRYSHRLAWLSNRKSLRSIIIILATLAISVILTVIGFIIGIGNGGYEGENFVMGYIQTVRAFLIPAGLLALLTVIEYQFLD